MPNHPATHFVKISDDDNGRPIIEKAEFICWESTLGFQSFGIWKIIRTGQILTLHRGQIMNLGEYGA